jgi:CspA family cold shock protein
MKNKKATCFGTIQKVHHLSARGFCFIVPDDGGADVFAHVRDFASPIDGIRRGDPVTYIVGKDGRSGKFRARNITRLPKEQFTGTVIAYSVDRGFGFIAPDNNFRDDVCVKESNLQESGIDKLETGDRVSFELLPKHHAHPRRGAVNLKIIESSHG